MQSFHNDTAIKAKYIARVEAHAAADELIQGTGWKNGKGCAIGCTLDGYSHARYPLDLGIPEWVARLEDTIFEGLPNELAMTWPIRFLEAIPVGMTDEQWQEVFWRTGEKRLMKLRDVQRAAIGDKWGVVAAIEGALAIYVSRSAADSARSAADSAYSAADSAYSAACSAYSALSAAYSAARSAADSAYSAAYSARSAAYSARSAAYSAADSARSAAYSARSAAYSAADSAAYIEESNWLLDAIKECTC